MKRISATLFSLGSLGVFVAWLFFSYRPGALPSLSLALGERFTPLMRALLLVSAVLFVALQALLLPPALRFPERVARRESRSPREGVSDRDEAALVLQTPSAGDIQVNRALELLWTGLPMVASAAIFWVSYQAVAW